MARGHQCYSLSRLCRRTTMIRTPVTLPVLRNHLLQNRETIQNHNIFARAYSSGSNPDDRKDEQNAELRVSVPPILSKNSYWIFMTNRIWNLWQLPHIVLQVLMFPLITSHRQRFHDSLTSIQQKGLGCENSVLRFFGIHKLTIHTSETNSEKTKCWE